MNDATKNISVTGKLVSDMICDGLELNAELAYEDRNYSLKELHEAIFKIVNKFGATAVLDALHGAAAVTGESILDCGSPMDELNDDVAALRLMTFCRRIDEAIKALR